MVAEPEQSDRRVEACDRGLAIAVANHPAQTLIEIDSPRRRGQQVLPSRRNPVDLGPESGPPQTRPASRDRDVRSLVGARPETVAPGGAQMRKPSANADSFDLIGSRLRRRVPPTPHAPNLALSDGGGELVPAEAAGNELPPGSNVAEFLNCREYRLHRASVRGATSPNCPFSASVSFVKQECVGWIGRVGAKPPRNGRFPAQVPVLRRKEGGARPVQWG